MINIYSTITTLSLLVLLVTAVDCAGNQLVAHNTKRRTRAVCMVIAVCTVCELLFVLTDIPLPEGWIRWSALLPEWLIRWIIILLRRIIKTIEFSCAPFIGITVALAYGDAPRPKLAMGAAGVHLVFQWIALFFGWVFRVDAMNGYHRGILFPVYIAAFALSAVYAFVAVVRNSRHYQMGVDTVLVLIGIFLVVGIGSVYLVPGVQDTYLCIALGNLLVYSRHYKIMLQVDAVTGLLNRRCYEVNITNLGSRGVILLFDVDKFKQVNDTYGHNVGDICLNSTAAILREVYGKSGLCYRIGGDEFCVILSQDVDQLETFNQQFRDRLQALRAEDPRMPGLSMGYAVYDAAASFSVDDVIQEADAMLYKNKKAAFGG